jgi:hypothetical protein
MVAFTAFSSNGPCAPGTGSGSTTTTTMTMTMEEEQDEARVVRTYGHDNAGAHQA